MLSSLCNTTVSLSLYLSLCLSIYSSYAICSEGLHALYWVSKSRSLSYDVVGVCMILLLYGTVLCAVYCHSLLPR